MPGGGSGRAVVWVARRDLRVFDNDALSSALGAAREADCTMYALFAGGSIGCGKRGAKTGGPRLGRQRAEFVAEAVESLARTLLHEYGVRMFMHRGGAADGVRCLGDTLGAVGWRVTAVHITGLPGVEEAKDELLAEEVLREWGSRLVVHDGWLTVPLRRLPYPAWGSRPSGTEDASLDELTVAAASRLFPGDADAAQSLSVVPNTMTRFRKAVTGACELQPCAPRPPRGHAAAGPALCLPASLMDVVAVAEASPDAVDSVMRFLLGRDASPAVAASSVGAGAAGAAGAVAVVVGRGGPRALAQHGTESAAWDHLCWYTTGEASGSGGRAMQPQLVACPPTPLAPREEAGAWAAKLSAPVDTFHESRAGLPTTNGQARLGAYLAHGVLSARACATAALVTRPADLYGTTLAAEGCGGGAGGGRARRRRRDPPPKGRDHLVMHLLIRDFFAVQMLKHGRRWFQLGGIRGGDGAGQVCRTLSADDAKTSPHTSGVRLQLWRAEWRVEMRRLTEARTGVPLVDAASRQLQREGTLSNRARQCVASYVVHDARIPWLAAAEWFERWLTDYEVASNYVNWAYFAGVGNDPLVRKFDLVSQGTRYDPGAAFLAANMPQPSERGGGGGSSGGEGGFASVAAWATLDLDGPTSRTLATLASAATSAPPSVR